MDYSISTRYGYALIRDTGSGKTLVAAPHQTDQILAFVILGTFEDYDDAFLYVVALSDSGSKPEDFTGGSDGDSPQDSSTPSDEGPVGLLASGDTEGGGSEDDGVLVGSVVTE